MDKEKYLWFLCQKYNVTEETLNSTIEKLYKEVEDNVRRFEEISGK